MSYVKYKSNIYDVGSFMEYHPGGKELLLHFIGEDITDEFLAFHRPEHELYFEKLQVVSLGCKENCSNIQKDFRELRNVFERKGFFKKDWKNYVSTAVMLFLMFFSSIILAIGDSVVSVVCGAILLGCFFQQVAFIGHDCGHLSVHSNRKNHNRMGLFVGNFLTGISISWWKSTHNTHHALTNSVVDDCDVQHLPVFAVNQVQFDSIYSTYHKKTLEYNWLARNICIPYQHILYYPIMTTARFVLYLKSIVYIVQNPNILEIVSEMGFFVWYFALIGLIDNFRMRIMFHLISHAIAGILQVQITLSHFAEPMNNGNDFYSRNIEASLDICCSPWLDFLHGGLQFQCVHHLFPRLHKYRLREAQQYVKELCDKHDLKYKELSFIDANRKVIRHLKSIAKASQVWSPKIYESIIGYG